MKVYIFPNPDKNTEMVSSDFTHLLYSCPLLDLCVPESTRDISNQSHGQVETACMPCISVELLLL